MPEREPIWIPCEGSETPPMHGMFLRRLVLCTICPMCGEQIPADELISKHDRLDILAMIGRGDFG